MITTVIGAYPKPYYLKLPDWFSADGGTDTAYPTKNYKKAIENMGSEAEKIFLKATKEVIDDQLECGLDIITDGEVRRENYIHYHCRHLEGIDFNTLTKKVARTGNYECWLPTITNEIRAKDSFLVDDWIQAQKLSSKPIKITLPGPLTISDTISNNYYNSEKKMGEDLAKALNIEIKKLVNAGCKYIQIDEPLFARKPKNAIEFGIANLEMCFDDVNNSDVEKITHICCGYPDKLDSTNYPKAPLKSYHEIAEFLDNSILDCISIEDAHRYNDLSLLDKFKKTKIILGLIKVASSNEEAEEEIVKRVKKASQHIDIKHLIAAPDCGLGHLPRNLAIKKLTTLVNAVKDL